MINTLAILSIASLTAMNNTAFAQSYGRGEGKSFPKFSDLDLKGYKRISKKEITTHLKARFASMDQNNDGTLSIEEMIAQYTKASDRRINKMIRNMDANFDGQMSFEEIQNGRTDRKQANMLNKLDDDANGFISCEELKDNRHGKLFRLFTKDQKDDGQIND